MSVRELAENRALKKKLVPFARVQGKSEKHPEVFLELLPR